MAKRLAYIIALGTALAVIGAASANSLTVGVGGVTVTTPNLPGGAPNPLPDTTVTTPKLPNPGGGGSAGGGGGGLLGGGGSSSGGGGSSSGGGSSTSTSSTGASSGGSTSGKGTKKGGGKGLFSKQKGKRQTRKDVVVDQKTGVTQPILRNPDGSPTPQNPGLTTATFGPAPIGVPNPVIDSFEIPPFLLPIYQSCGTEYGIPWQVLAGINKIETAFGTNLNVSSAGAEGWMQFIPSTWAAYGVDANEDGRKDPYNPVDAICAAARYLRAAGGDTDLRQAIFSYNHADWYVDEVLLYANQYGKLPDALVGSLTGLTEGAHFPVAADARYADDINDATALSRSTTQRRASGNAADVVASNAQRRSINIYSSLNAPVVAVNDGIIKKMGDSKELGKFIVLQDAYGNRYTYGHLGEIAKVHPVPRQDDLSAKDFQLTNPNRDAAPSQAASAGDNSQRKSAAAPKKRKAASAPRNTEGLRSRLFALPHRPGNAEQAGVAGQLDQLLGRAVPGYETFKSAFAPSFSFDQKTMQLKPLKVGSKVTGGTVIGRVGQPDQAAPHLNFAIRPAGRGAPNIDPKPILDGWKLLEATAVYRASGRNVLYGKDNAGAMSIGQILLLPKPLLERRVLSDERIDIYEGGRQDIRSGQIDRRVLATLAYLAESGLRPTVSCLKNGHGFYTSSGNVSEHSSGNAVDISMVNGIPILGHQETGGITEQAVRRLMQLQGTMYPHQIISLLSLGGSTFAMADHNDHIHVGFHPMFGANKKLGKQTLAVLEPGQWSDLISRLGEIENPVVPTKPSKYALPAHPKRASQAHVGE